MTVARGNLDTTPRSQMTREKALRLLDLKSGATKEAIKKAFREKALLFHPDKNKNNDAAETFQQIHIAYKFLINHPTDVDQYKFFKADNSIGRLKDAVSFLVSFGTKVKELLEKTDIPDQVNLKNYVRDKKVELEEAISIIDPVRWDPPLPEIKLDDLLKPNDSLSLKDKLDASLFLGTFGNSLKDMLSGNESKDQKEIEKHVKEQREQLHESVKIIISIKDELIFFKKYNSEAAFNGTFLEIMEGKSQSHTNEESIKQYVIDNKDAFQEMATKSSIHCLTKCFLETQKHHLLILLDISWLMQWNEFTSRSQLFFFLKDLPATYWETFFNDYLGGNWLKEYCEDVSNFTYFLNTLPTESPHHKINNVNLKTFLTYLGLQWLREVWYLNTQTIADTLGPTLNFRWKSLLTFLDGEDQWLRRVTDIPSIGIVFKSLSHSGEFTARQHRDIKSNWANFLTYFDVPYIIQQCLEHRDQLNALLTNLANVPFQYDEEKHLIKYNQPNTNSIVLFLQTYLPAYLTKKQFGNLKELIKLLSIIANVEFNSISLQIVKNLGIVCAFSDSEMYDILFQYKNINGQDQTYTVKQVLSTIQSHKYTIFYRALLLAIAKAYRHQRTQAQAEYAGSSYGYSQQAKLNAVDSLIDAILANTPIDNKLHPAILQGNLGAISALYAEDHTPGFLSTIKNFLLGGPAGPQLQLMDVAVPQLTYTEEETPISAEHSEDAVIVNEKLLNTGLPDDSKTDNGFLSWSEFQEKIHDVSLSIDEINNYYIRLDKKTLRNNDNSGVCMSFCLFFAGSHTPEFIKKMLNIRQTVYDKLLTEIKGLGNNENAIIKRLQAVREMAIVNDHRNNHWYEGAFGNTTTVQNIDALLKQHGIVSGISRFLCRA